MSRITQVKSAARTVRSIGIRGKMVLSIAVILACGLIASVVAVVGYSAVDGTIATIAGRSIPAMNEAQGLALQAERLVSVAPIQVDSASLSARIKAAAEEYGRVLDQVRINDRAGERFEALEAASKALLANLAELDAATVRSLELAGRRAGLEKAVYDAEKVVRDAITPFKSDLKGQHEDELNV